jgi:hypothetical protein
VTTRSVRYRGYVFAVYAPADPGDRWHVLIWPPSKDAPTIMPTHASESEAIEEAQAAVDQLLLGAGQQTP